MPVVVVHNDLTLIRKREQTLPPSSAQLKYDSERPLCDLLCIFQRRKVGGEFLFNLRFRPSHREQNISKCCSTVIDLYVVVLFFFPNPRTKMQRRQCRTVAAVAVDTSFPLISAAVMFVYFPLCVIISFSQLVPAVYVCFYGCQAVIISNLYKSTLSLNGGKLG